MKGDFYCDSVLNGQVPVSVVAETDRVLAFHHVFKTWETHVVVISKQHVGSLVDVDDPGLLAELFEVVITVIKTLGLAETNYKVITNGGTFQGNRHLHIHVVSGRPLDPANPAQHGELLV